MYCIKTFFSGNVMLLITSVNDCWSLCLALRSWFITSSSWHLKPCVIVVGYLNALIYGRRKHKYLWHTWRSLHFSKYAISSVNLKTLEAFFSSSLQSFTVYSYNWLIYSIVASKGFQNLYRFFTSHQRQPQSRQRGQRHYNFGY